MTAFVLLAYSPPHSLLARSAPAPLGLWFAAAAATARCSPVVSVPHGLSCSHGPSFFTRPFLFTRPVLFTGGIDFTSPHGIEGSSPWEGKTEGGGDRDMDAGGGSSAAVQADSKELQLLAYVLRLLERKRLLMHELKRTLATLPSPHRTSPL